MAAPGVPSNFIVQTANQQILVSWDLSAGATSYIVQRSLDDIAYTTIATVTGSPLATQYLDTAVTLGVNYFYKVQAAQVPSFQAVGTIVFTGQPNPGDTFSVANVIFTAVASGAVANQFNIAGTIAQTIANIVISVTNDLTLTTTVIASNSPTVLTFTAYETGPEGNGLQLSSALTNTTITPFSGGSPSVASPFTSSASATPTPTGEMTLSQIRLAAQQRADRVNSQFVTQSEWRGYINQAMFELYDLLITVFEDYYIAEPVTFQTNGAQFLYPLPNGSNTFTSFLTQLPFIPRPFYKLRGVDLATQTNQNGWVSIRKFNFSDRNNFVFPNSGSTIYGVFNCQYRVMGSNIEFIPVPSANQIFRLWYIPRLTELLLETDTTDIGISGWLEYVICRAAKYALDKEESDSTVVTQEIQFLIKRIEETAANRDVNQPDTIQNINRGPWGNGWSNNGGGGNGGF